MEQMNETKYVQKKLKKKKNQHAVIEHLEILKAKTGKENGERRHRESKSEEESGLENWDTEDKRETKGERMENGARINDHAFTC